MSNRFPTRRVFTALTLTAVLTGASFGAFAQKPVELLNVSYDPIPAKLVRSIVVGPIARLELLPLDASAAGSGDIMEAQIAARRFAEMALKDGEILMLTPRRAKVFVAQS